MNKISANTEANHSPDELIAFIRKVLIIIAFWACIYFLYLLTPILTILFFSGFLTILFSPFLDRMARYKIPNWLGIILIFSLFFIFFLLAAFAIIPIFVKQIALLFGNITGTFTTMEEAYRSGGVASIGLPAWMLGYIESFDFGTFFEFVRGHASSLANMAGSGAKQIASGSANIVSSISGGIVQGLIILIFTFFMSLERSKIKGVVYDLLPTKSVTYLRAREARVTQILSAWIQWQFLLGVSIFFLTLVGLFSLRILGIEINEILTLALIAGLMEFIPYIGPFLALLPALAIAAGMGFAPVVAVFVLYILIQQIENNVLVPMIMSKTLDLSPFLILATMTAWFSLFGIVGILLAIPFAALLKIAVSDFITWKKSWKTKKKPSELSGS